MYAVKLYLRNVGRYDLTTFTNILTDNGYTVTYDKGNNVKTVVRISKNENTIKTNADKFKEVFGFGGHTLIDQHAQWWDCEYEEPKEDA